MKRPDQIVDSVLMPQITDVTDDCVRLSPQGHIRRNSSNTIGLWPVTDNRYAIQRNTSTLRFHLPIRFVGGNDPVSKPAGANFKELKGSEDQPIASLRKAGHVHLRCKVVVVE